MFADLHTHEGQHFYMLRFMQASHPSPSQSSSVFNRTTLGLGCIVLIWLAVSLPSVMTYPTPTSDDAWFGSMAWSFVQTGSMHSTFISSTGHQDGIAHVAQGYILGLSALFSFLGPSLHAARLFGVAGQLLGAILLYLVARKITNKAVAVSTFAFYLFSIRALQISHLVRPESWVSAFTILQILILLSILETPTFRKGLLLGLTAWVTITFYIMAAHTAIFVGLVVLYTVRKNRDRQLLVGYSIGALVGMVGWICIQLVTNNDPSLENWLILFGSGQEQKASGLSLYFSRTQLMIVKGFIQHSSVGIVEVALAVIGCGYAIFAKYEYKVILLGWAFALWQSLFFPYRNLLHSVDFLSVFSIFMSLGLFAMAIGVCKIWPQRQELIFTALVLPVVAVFIYGSIKLGYANRVVDFPQYSADLIAAVPANTKIMGEGTWWWVFNEGNYVYDFQLSELNINDDIMAETLDDWGIDIVLLDEDLASWVPPSHSMHVFLKDHVLANCTRIDSVSGPFYGIETGQVAEKVTDIYDCR